MALILKEYGMHKIDCAKFYRLTENLNATSFSLSAHIRSVNAKKMFEPDVII